MRVIVQSETRELFSYDTAKESECLFPHGVERPAAIAALAEALAFISHADLKSAGNEAPKRPSLSVVPPTNQ